MHSNQDPAQSKLTKKYKMIKKKKKEKKRSDFEGELGGWGGVEQVWNFQRMASGTGSNHWCMCAKSLQSCLILCDAMGCSLPGSSVRGILQTRILEMRLI